MVLSRSWGRCERYSPDPLDVTYNMRHKQCKEPRDKIFGILGMVGYVSDMEDFKLNYTMTVAQVYEEVARVALSQN